MQCLFFTDSDLRVTDARFFIRYVCHKLLIKLNIVCACLCSLISLLVPHVRGLKCCRHAPGPLGWFVPFGKTQYIAYDDHASEHDDCV